MTRRTDSNFKPIPGKPGCSHNPDLADQLLGPLDPTLRAIANAHRTTVEIWKSLYYAAADERDALKRRVRELEGK